MATSNRMISRVVKALAGGAVGVALLGTGSTASADSTCNTLLANVTSRAQVCVNVGGFGCIIAHHTTNFLTLSSEGVAQTQFGGYTDAPLGLSNGHIVGSGSRLHSDRFTGSQPFDVNQGEAISYDWDPSGKLTMDGIYGPADPVCYFDTFMVIVGSGSVEVFSFEPSPFP
jgi:hypothetical protein